MEGLVNTKAPSRDVRNTQHQRDMLGYVLGPVPAPSFIELFLPGDVATRRESLRREMPDLCNDFTSFKDGMAESDMYPKMVREHV